MELARKIRVEDKNVGIVFITSTRDYALLGYDVNALHYLIKPVNRDVITDRGRRKPPPRCQRLCVTANQVLSCGILWRSRHYELCSDEYRKRQAVEAKREFNERAKGDRLEQLDEAAYYYWYNRLRKLSKGKKSPKA